MPRGYCLVYCSINGFCGPFNLRNIRHVTAKTTLSSVRAIICMCVHPLRPLREARLMFKPDINSLSQISGAARLVGTKANISVPDHGQSLLTSPPTDQPPPPPAPPPL